MSPKKAVKKTQSKKSYLTSDQKAKLKYCDELNRDKSEFIAEISHELRTPLAIIMQLMMLLYDETDGPINDKQREILVKTRHNIDRLKNMINNLLDITTLERDMLSLQYSLVNLNQMFKDTKDFFQHKAAEKNIQLIYSLPREEVCIFVDAERILQVITNLINNAIKFTRENKSIRIDVKLMGADVRIGVIDTGIGIDKSKLSQIFEKYVQVSKDAEAKKGIGMGLTIVKQLVEKHGGQATRAFVLIIFRFLRSLNLISTSESIGIGNALTKQMPPCEISIDFVVSCSLPTHFTSTLVL